MFACISHSSRNKKHSWSKSARDRSLLKIAQHEKTVRERDLGGAGVVVGDTERTQKTDRFIFFFFQLFFLTNRINICICTFVPLAREVFLFSLRHSVISGRGGGRNKCVWCRREVMVTENTVQIRNVKYKSKVYNKGDAGVYGNSDLKERSFR